MMMIANLIGFCVGLDGIIDLLKGILGSYYGTKIPRLLEMMLTGGLGLAFVIAVVVSLFIATQVMFEIREDEKRKGINLRC
jgi:protein-cysteine N-palmitoyltransferase HHAT